MTAPSRSVGGGLRLVWVLTVAVMGVVGALDLARRLSTTSFRSLEVVLGATEAERADSDLERLWPGGAELFAVLREEVPANGLIVGLYPREEEAAADPALVDRRATATALMWRLRVLLYPTRVRRMPRRELDAAELRAPGLDAVRFLDLGFVDRALLEEHLEPAHELEGGTIWRPRTEEGGQ